MIHLEVAQGSHEWLMARCGLPTASQFHRIVTPKGALSASRKRYMHDLLAETILGRPLDTFTSDAMNRGTDMEAEAVAAYEFERGIDTQVCGLCLTDDRLVGASPDRLIPLPDDKLAGLQVKCPSEPGIHIGYLLGNLADQHKAQVQGEIHVGEMVYEDLISYYPGLPLAVVRVLPDEKYQEALRKALDAFTKELAALVEKADREGWIQEARPATVDNDQFINDDDVTAILAARQQVKQQLGKELE